MSKRIILEDIYLQYPYKDVDVKENTVPKPYVPYDQISDHKWKLTYKEWKKIISIYLREWLKYLMTGQRYKLDNKLGDVQIMKYKPKKKRLNLGATLKTGKKVYHNNLHTNNYCPIFIWHREHVRFPFKWHWRFRLTKKAFGIISDNLKEDFTAINRYIEYNSKKNKNSKHEV